MTLSYEQVNELKEAGFPQKSMTIGEPKEYTGDGSYIPTLSELVEACGEQLDILQRHGNMWDAVSFSLKPDEQFDTYFSTPEEAVARLWLALNKK